jgi:uncharacterized protein
MSDLPAFAAWRHLDVRQGFEVLFAQRRPDDVRLEGYTAGVEEGEAWGMRYRLVLDLDWTTRSALVAGRSSVGTRSVRIEADGDGDWTVDGAPAPEIAGCRDVDLEASACTNALPVNRLRLAVGDRAEAPAAYVRAIDLRVERLEQIYARVADHRGSSRYDYRAPELGFADQLAYDGFGLVLDYPGIAVRVA